MANFINKLYKSQQFKPNLISLFINPFFLVRREIYNGVKRNAGFLSGKLLDYGCGSKPYKNLFNNVEEYIGVDVEQEGHTHENEDVDIYYDGKKLPFENETFNSCFSCEVFEHVFELEASLGEIFRVMKKGGKGLFLVPFVWDEHETPYDFGRYSSFGLKYLLEKQGFKIVKHEKDSHFAEVIGQLISLYVFNLIKTRNKYFNLVLFFIFITPFNILGILMKYILPRHKGLYFNNVFVVEK